jgi:hypothetical protein
VTKNLPRALNARGGSDPGRFSDPPLKRHRCRSAGSSLTKRWLKGSATASGSAPQAARRSASGAFELPQVLHTFRD